MKPFSKTHVPALLAMALVALFAWAPALYAQIDAPSFPSPPAPGDAVENADLPLTPEELGVELPDMQAAIDQMREDGMGPEEWAEFLENNKDDMLEIMKLQHADLIEQKNQELMKAAADARREIQERIESGETSDEPLEWAKGTEFEGLTPAMVEMQAIMAQKLTAPKDAGAETDETELKQAFQRIENDMKRRAREGGDAEKRPVAKPPVLADSSRAPAKVSGEERVVKDAPAARRPAEVAVAEVAPPAVRSSGSRMVFGGAALLIFVALAVFLFVRMRP